MSKKLFYIFLFFVTNIVIAIGFLHRIIKDIFGVVTLEQIVFNFQGAGGNIDSSFYPLIFLWSGLFLIVFLCHCGIFVNYVWKRKVFDRSIAYKILRIVELKIVDIINHSPRYTYIFISVVICACIGSFIERKYDVLSFIHRPDSNFIENNYVIPKIEFTEKRNLVLVFLESMERGYTNENIFGKNLIPDLQRLAQANTTFIGHEESIGSEWTQAAHVNMLMGIPLLLSKNGKSKVQEFLPGALSITDVLRQNGYKLYSLFGATGKFAEMEKLFRSHGVEHVWERDHFDSQGYNKAENKGTDWGYKDSFIFEKMLNLYQQLNSSNEPFCLIMRTVDTHFPHGFVEKKDREFGDIRDTFVQANRMSVEFLEKIKAIGSENTTIVFIGDHLWMDTPGTRFTDVMMPNLRDRQIYNVFINSSVKKEHQERYRGYAAFDMAPTILESIGAKLEGRRFGLGTSLFSKEKTLVERYGIAHINEELKKHSSFYGRFVSGTLD